MLESDPELAARLRVLLVPEEEQVPALLDRAALARALGVSLGSLDRLRKRASFPELRLGDSARFELEAVIDWIRRQQKRGGLRVVEGAER